MEEREFVTLEDGISYMIVDEIEVDKVNYVYLAEEDKPESFRIRKIEKAGNIEMLVGLDSDTEFDKAMLAFVKRHKEDI